MSVLKFIWGALQRIWRWIRHLVDFVVQIYSSVLAWIITGIAWLVHEIFQYFGDLWYNMFDTALDITIGDVPVSPLASWIAHDVIALDVAWECVTVMIGVWIASRIGRLSVVFVRTIIDLL